MNKSRFEHLVEKRMRKKKQEKQAETLDFNTLLEMMEQLGALVPLNEGKGQTIEELAKELGVDLTKLPEDYVKLLPKFEMSEMWGIKDDPSNAARDDFEKWVGSAGGSVKQRLENMEQFVLGDEGLDVSDASTTRILNNLVFLDLLSTVVNNFSPSGAGFLFEAFLAGLLKGTQQIEKTAEGELDIDDLRDAEGKPISLKLLVPTTAVKGSIKNLLGFLAKSEDADTGIEYLCVYKYGEGASSALGFYSFYLTPSNIYYWLASNFGFKTSFINESISPELAPYQITDIGPIEKPIDKLRSQQDINMQKAMKAAGVHTRAFNNAADILATLNNSTDAAKAIKDTAEAFGLAEVDVANTKYKIDDAFPSSLPTADQVEELQKVLNARRSFDVALNNTFSKMITRKKTYDNKNQNTSTLDFVNHDKVTKALDDTRKQVIAANYENFTEKDKKVALKSAYAWSKNRVPTVSNLKVVRDHMLSDDGMEGAKMMLQVAKEYGHYIGPPDAENNKKGTHYTYLSPDSDTVKAIRTAGADDLTKIIKIRRKVINDLRKKVRPDDERLGWFKNTYSAVEPDAAAQTSIDALKAKFDAGDKIGWANDLLGLAGLTPLGQPDADDEGDDAGSDVLQEATGKKTQFEISSDLVTKTKLPPLFKKERLGVLKIDRKSITAVASTYRDSLQSNVLLIFHVLHNLTESISDYFLMKDDPTKPEQTGRTGYAQEANTAAEQMSELTSKLGQETEPTAE